MRRRIIKRYSTYHFGIALELIGHLCPEALKPGNVGDHGTVVATIVVWVDDGIGTFGVGDVVDNGS